MKTFSSNVIRANIIVVGAGVAGATIAGELHRSGNEVVVLDQNPSWAMETSGHHMALAHPQVGRKITKLQRFTELANTVAFSKWNQAAWIKSAFEPKHHFNHENIIDLKEHLLEMGFGQNSLRVLNQQEAKKIVNVNAPGLLYEKAAVYRLPKICEWELQGISCHWNIKASFLRKNGEYWEILNDQKKVIALSKVIVLANGLGVSKLLKTIEYELLLRPVRGQITSFQIKNTSPIIAKLPIIPLRGDGYCMPARQENEKIWSWQIGSSYDEDVDSLVVNLKANQDNAIKGLNLIGCDHSHIGEFEVVNNFIGIRSASKDRLPLIGPIHGEDGLFIATAYGSRGVLWSALGAQLIQAYVEAFLAGADRLRAGFLIGADTALSAEVATSVLPARFRAGAFTARASNSKPIFPVS
jgi:tRNA 5-methylaminomethyl-2-thiouridine biosynthesis bifunctional protein